jgi:hypothetical protein
MESHVLRRLAWIAILLQVAAFIAWRRDRRIGSGLMNRHVAPVLIRTGVAGAGRSELGTIEHVGRVGQQAGHLTAA